MSSTRPTTPPASPVPGTPTYTPPAMMHATPPHVIALQAALDAAGPLSLVVGRGGDATLYCGKGGSFPVTLHDARAAA